MRDEAAALCPYLISLPAHNEEMVARVMVAEAALAAELEQELDVGILNCTGFWVGCAQNPNDFKFGINMLSILFLPFPRSLHISAFFFRKRCSMYSV